MKVSGRVTEVVARLDVGRALSFGCEVKECATRTALDWGCSPLIVCTLEVSDVQCPEEAGARRRSRGEQHVTSWPGCSAQGQAHHDILATDHLHGPTTELLRWVASYFQGRCWPENTSTTANTMHG
ncbi:hypothetical protein WJX72_002395 [[Myrmecia] bisecta]|uniref:Uncharacterized protein n=1 Tax=[Myrmecia] bisecta TaxID=41462 RepID=A0AAW1P1E4_9CHLO